MKFVLFFLLIAATLNIQSILITLGDYFKTNNPEDSTLKFQFTSFRLPESPQLTLFNEKGEQIGNYNCDPPVKYHTSFNQFNVLSQYERYFVNCNLKILDVESFFYQLKTELWISKINRYESKVLTANSTGNLKILMFGDNTYDEAGLQTLHKIS